MLNIVVYGYGEREFAERDEAEVVSEYHLFAGLLVDGVVILLHVK